MKENIKILCNWM